MTRVSSNSHGPTFIFWLLESRWLAPVIAVLLAGTASWLLEGGLITFILSLVGIPLSVGFVLLSLFIMASWCHDGGKADWEEFIECKDLGFAKKWAGTKIPIETVIEAYMDQKIDFKTDFYEVFLRRNDLFRFCFTWNIIKFYVFTFLGQNIDHSEKHDHSEIAHVYNRGNDFYNWFLGPTMIYTSGIYEDQKESLERAQVRKLDRVCQQMHMKKGAEHLDIGCGWGTLVCHAAKHFGTNSTGVTLAQEQANWGLSQAKDEKVSDQVNIMVCDYREIPTRTNNKKYDAITCLEMAEHVGIKNFQKFLNQVSDMLKDDGLFYLQIAGLRRPWQYEDLVWGVFMGKYIFPAADASCPLGFVTSQLERAGFEVHRVENTGVHYSLTIKAWYDNWVSNKDKVVAKYGMWWYRLWVVFLAWSAIIAAQGSSTVFMITCNKNHKNDKASVYDPDTAPFGRMDTWVGPKTVAIQQ